MDKTNKIWNKEIVNTYTIKTWWNLHISTWRDDIPMILYRHYTYLENILMLSIEKYLHQENESLKDTKLKEK